MRLSFIALTLIEVATALPAQPADRATVLFPFVIDWNDIEKDVATDDSFLNLERAGKHGFITTKDGHFFEPSTGNRIRFFGINLKYDGLFPDHEDAETIAAHLAKSGFNLVRIHPLDGWNWNPKNPQTLSLDRSKQDRLDYLISQLNDHGLYIDLVLHSIEDCHSSAFAGRSPSLLNGVDEFSHNLIRDQKQSAAKILSHVNRYSSVSLANNPALAMVEINNESSLSTSALEESWLKDLPPKLHSELEMLWNRWMKNRSREAREEQSQHQVLDLPVMKAGANRSAFEDFLRSTERIYVQNMRNYLRQELHVKACLIGSQLSSGGPPAILRESDMEYSDYHAYWEHPRFPGKPWDEHNWRIVDKSMLDGLVDNSGDFLQQICQSRVNAKPYSLSEFNEPAPNDYQVEAVPVVALLGAFQDWDSICLFEYGEYGNNAESSKIHSFFDIGDNPAKCAFIPSAAMLFRTAAFPPAQKCSLLNVSDAALVQAQSLVQVWAAYRTVAPFIDRLSLSASNKIAAPTLDRTDAQQGKQCSSIKLSQTPRGKMLLAESDQADAVVGFLGGQLVRFGQDVVIDFGHTSNDFGALMLVSLDDRSLGESRHLLLSVANRTQNSGFKWNKDRSTAQEAGTAPTLVEGVPAQIQIRNHNIHFVHSLDNRGRRKAIVPLADDNSFSIGPDNESVWFEISDR